jgi:hypothetical protein
MLLARMVGKTERKYIPPLFMLMLLFLFHVLFSMCPTKLLYIYLEINKAGKLKTKNSTTNVMTSLFQ